MKVKDFDLLPIIEREVNYFLLMEIGDAVTCKVLPFTSTTSVIQFFQNKVGCFHVTNVFHSHLGFKVIMPTRKQFERLIKKKEGVFHK